MTKVNKLKLSIMIKILMKDLFNFMTISVVLTVFFAITYATPVLAIITTLTVVILSLISSYIAINRMIVSGSIEEIGELGDME